MARGKFDMNDQGNTCAIAAIRTARWWVKSIAAVVLITFSGLVTSPAAAAVHAELERQQRLAPREQGEAEKLNTVLLEVKEQLGILAGKPKSGLAAASAAPAVVAERQTAREALKSLRKQMQALDQAAREDFREIGQHIRQHGLSDVILQRHQAAVAKYEAEATALLESLAVLETADQDAVPERAKKAFERLEKQQLQRSQKPFDPNKLPFSMPDNNVRAPATTPAQFLDVTSLVPELEPALLLASTNDAIITGFAADDPANPDYLAATPDAQITPAIKALATELEHNPVKLYNWVRNNIEYLPTYGSIQGAQLTLDNRKGNAFDTASLLIALLRASDIPARYVYGTVEIPADQVMNWVGGVADPMAAGNLLGQGGIPHTALVSGGVVKAFRLEHIWVEAWVDFYPSRGAINKIGDTWVPLDASFKQYQYVTGLDLQNEVPFDAETFAQQITASATVNEAEGWVQGVDQTLIQSKLDQYRQQVETFIDAQAAGTTVGDVLGTKTIVEQHLPILAGGLPIKQIAVGNRYAELPDGLRYKFRYALTDQYGAELVAFEDYTVNLAGKRLALSFRPASQADVDTIISYLPEPPADGSDVDPSQLPDSLPGYLINLTAEFTVNGEVIETGPTVTMGTELSGRLGYYIPNTGWDLRPKPIVAGEYQAVGLDLAGISRNQLAQLKSDLEQVQVKLENENPTGLTRHSLTGTILQSGVLSYFAINDLQDKLAAKSAGIVASRLPSFGSLSTKVQTHYWYGVPRDVSFPGVNMDIDSLYSQVVDKANEQKDVVGFMGATGSRISALEHMVPEEMFSTASDEAHGVSAVKALAIAQAEGQRVYTITTENLATALAAVNAESAIESEIRIAVSAGKQVTIHQNPISYYGWQGHGYIVLDLETGAGAYKISGGTNGGDTEVQNGTLLNLLGGILEFGKAAASNTALFKWMGGLVAAFGMVLDFIKLLQACGLEAAIGLAIANLFITVGIMGLFSAALLLPISALVIGIILAIGAIIASFVIAFLVDQSVKSCPK